MKKLEVILNGLELSMQGPKSKERLKLRNGYPETEFSRSIFAQLGLMHLIAPYFPEVVQANFGVSPRIKKLIGAMYKSEGHQQPTFQLPRNGHNLTTRKVRPNRVVVAYSAGKDSMWNMWWAQKKHGTNNVMAVHINGLNKHNAPREKEYSIRQARELGFRHFEIIDLLNSSQNNGYQVMRSRDMFMTGIVVPLAIKFGASQIITEGFGETGINEPFTGLEKNMLNFNEVLKSLGVPIKVAWRNSNEMDVVRDVYENVPEWMPHVCNCFSAPCYQPSRRRYWIKNTPTFNLYDSQCGSCVKCRIVNLGRILYDSSAKKIADKDVVFFLTNTSAWAKTNRQRLADMIEGSFTRDFIIACKRYGVKPQLAA